MVTLGARLLRRTADGWESGTHNTWAIVLLVQGRHWASPFALHHSQSSLTRLTAAGIAVRLLGLHGLGMLASAIAL